MYSLMLSHLPIVNYCGLWYFQNIFVVWVFRWIEIWSLFFLRSTKFEFLKKLFYFICTIIILINWSVTVWESLYHVWERLPKIGYQDAACFMFQSNIVIRSVYQQIKTFLSSLPFCFWCKMQIYVKHETSICWSALIHTQREKTWW